MDKTLTRTIPTKIRVKDSRRLTFYASVFNVEATVSDDGGRSFYKESIMPTAFDAFLATEGEVIANVDHDPARTYARRSTGELLLQTDPHGLFASCWLPETPLGNAVLAAVEAGELDGASFRFRPVADVVGADGTVQRSSVVLEDVCLTSTPAYPQTLGEVHVRTNQKIKDMERTLRFVRTKLKLKTR